MVIKAHGSSDAKAFSNAIRQAIGCVKQGVVDIIAKDAARLAEEKKKAADAARLAEEKKRAASEE